jgi:hypothetical protein
MQHPILHSFFSAVWHILYYIVSLIIIACGRPRRRLLFYVGTRCQPTHDKASIHATHLLLSYLNPSPPQRGQIRQQRITNLHPIYTIQNQAHLSPRGRTAAPAALAGKTSRSGNQNVQRARPVPSSIQKATVRCVEGVWYVWICVERGGRGLIGVCMGTDGAGHRGLRIHDTYVHVYMYVHTNAPCRQGTKVVAYF